MVVERLLLFLYTVLTETEHCNYTKKIWSPKDTDDVAEEQVVCEFSAFCDGAHQVAKLDLVLWPIVLHQHDHVTQQLVVIGARLQRLLLRYM